MAELTFLAGPMDSGKSILALQFDHQQRAGGRVGRLFTRRDRAGSAVLSSRLGVSRPAVEVDDDFDFWCYAQTELASGRLFAYAVCDEAQFYTAGQIDQLARLVDELDVEVFAVGILTDFRTRMFAGSLRLVELCDRMLPLPVGPLCWCGRPATHNARLVGGSKVSDGEQIVVGDLAGEQGPGAAAYVVLCRRHHRSGQLAASAPVPEESR